MTFQELLAALEPFGGIYLAGHVHPDGDCVGSAVGLAGLLEKAGKRARILMREIPGTLEFLYQEQPGLLLEEPDGPVEALVVLDSGDPERLGEYEPYFHQAKCTVNIDHHASNAFFAMHNVVDEHASSTSEMVFRMLEEGAGDYRLLDDSTAQALYTGIVYDTGAFKHSNTGRRTHEAAGRLIEFEFPATEIIDRMFYYKSLQAIRVQGEAIRNLQTHRGNRIVLSYVTQSFLDTLGAEKKDVEGIVQILNDIEGTDCAIFLYGLGDQLYKASLRSKGRVDVCAVASGFGGGGHKKAAGCTMQGPLEESIRSLLQAVGGQLE
ncbi:DHH family phosphoesterase [Anaerotalea alkaliphila]|uniref:Bifunctional oligoribonuclease/PAP phosphatase NrnA n=1 Tax=Anaerotalea alkaliphila TaxID=2662126 RepID=A0A7X5HTD8_9FIRM|nr:bifunctional oligoribonuclease/PAP phosphatase NrnA [Anaerotalea alkaliphila]NDL66322.1 bifunctional oligoribonuclease/PAP phosphatase NrnA [Anaerotalea alkaliphila]